MSGAVVQPTGPLRRLTGQEVKQLRDALLASFAGPNDLDDLVRFGLNERLHTFVGPGPTNRRVVDLIDWTEARDRTDELIAAAIDAAPKNRELRAIAELLRADDGAAGFERIVRPHLGLADATAFEDGLLRTMRAVCRVEFDGEGIGTGFLIGPSAVITNHHVVFDEHEVAARSDQLAFRFDYKRLDGKTTPGVVHRPAADTIIADSASAALDYTVVRLAAAAGRERVGEIAVAPVRGWLTPQGRAPVTNDPLIIVQHPRATPQKLALGTVVAGAADLPDRMRYNVNTDEGSSGAPCCASDWTPVALHHWGGADHNRGVLFSAILPDLQRKGVALDV